MECHIGRASGARISGMQYLLIRDNLWSGT